MTNPEFIASFDKYFNWATDFAASNPDRLEHLWLDIEDQFEELTSGQSEEVADEVKSCASEGLIEAAASAQYENTFYAE